MGEENALTAIANEGGALCMCILGQLCTDGRVWEAVFSVGSWKHSSCCRVGERAREGRERDKERGRESEGGERKAKV